jgi:hypothetical protein
MGIRKTMAKYAEEYQKYGILLFHGALAGKGNVTLVRYGIDGIKNVAEVPCGELHDVQAIVSEFNAVCEG